MPKNLEKLGTTSQEQPVNEQPHELLADGKELCDTTVEAGSDTPKLTEIHEAEQLPEFLPTVSEPGLSVSNTERQFNFDRQWLMSRKNKVEKLSSPARYIDLKPDGWEDSPPVVIAGGWSVGRSSLKETARVLYEDGRRVIIPESGRYEDLRPKNTWNEKRAQIKTVAVKAGERLQEFGQKVRDSAKIAVERERTPRPRITWNEKRAQIKTVAVKAGERLQEFNQKMKDHAKRAAERERTPRPRVTWDEEYLRIKTALVKGSKRIKNTLKDKGARIKAARVERRLRTKTLEGDLHPVIAGQAEALIDIINDSQMEKVEILSHSAGSLPALIAAQRHPELFSKLVLTMPAGTFDDSVKDLLLQRYRPKLIRSLTKDTLENPRAGLSINLGGLAYILKQPFKGYREIEAITSTRVRKSLVELSKREDVKVAILQANADPLFPAESIENNILTQGDRDSRGRWRKNGEPLVDAYSSINNREAGHDDLMINPDKTASKAALDILKHM